MGLGVLKYMNRKMPNLLIIFFVCGAINVQPLYSENIMDFIEKNKWDEDWFDLRIVDIPQVGSFFCVGSDNVLFRVSAPMTFPVLLITPITAAYANSYWGINCLLADVTVRINTNETELLKLSLARFLPISIWGGIPLSPRGMGIYILFEIVPFSMFNDIDYKKLYYGTGINTGIKYILSKHIEIELKYENYFPYKNTAGIWNKYIGLTFKYRLYDPDYYGPW
jgi:hypothetical protein